MGSNYFSKIIHYLASSNEFSYGNRLHICIYSSGDEFFFESLFSLENYWRSKLKLKKKITSIENGLILSGKIFKNPIENLPFKKNKKTYWNQWSYQNHAINESFIKGLKNLRIEKEIF